ncbi:hypothetical protein [Luteimonas sp. SDU82]|uniref:hypothetical protein n=1 Tax=Luteimonas sp. SDU82 TaxID=3422592 RepID=UPI003EBAF42E
MRDGPGDIRPSLLLLFHAQDGRQFEIIHRYGVGFLSTVCRRRGIRTRREVLELAAGDALAVMWCRRAPESVATRARRLGVRNSQYHALRAAAIAMFSRQLQEARDRFSSGTKHPQRSPQLVAGLSPPRAPPVPRRAKRGVTSNTPRRSRNPITDNSLVPELRN